MIALNAWPRQNGTGGERPRDHKPLPCDDIARNHKISPCKEPPVALRTIAFARYATPRPHCTAGGDTRAPTHRDRNCTAGGDTRAPKAKAPPPTAPPDTPPPPQPLRSPANSPQAPAAPPTRPPHPRAPAQARPPSRQIAPPTASRSPATRRDTTGYLRAG